MLECADDGLVADQLPAVQGHDDAFQDGFHAALQNLGVKSPCAERVSGRREKVDREN